MARPIDMTPTWASVLHVLLAGVEHGKTFEAREAARLELRHMAEAADKWNAHCKTSADAAAAAGVPSYSAVAHALRYLHQQATLSDLGARNAALIYAEAVLSKIPQEGA